jgi:hypothetical protein
MDIKTIGKVSLKVLGLALPLVMTLVDAKNNDTKMKEEIAKGIEEALKNQTKGS